MKTQQTGRTGHGHTWWMMLMCGVCLIPLAIVAGGAVLGGTALGLGGWSLASIPLTFLLCPLMMGGMMLLMGRNHGGQGGSCHGGDEAARRAPTHAPPTDR